MTEIDIRGGLPADAPLELTGEFTGYNNAATMQVGLWIRNDGEHIGSARYQAMTYGPRRLAVLLLHILSNAWHNAPGSAPAQVHDLFINGELRQDTIDWAQIAYDLIGEEPDEAELAEAVEAGARDGLIVTASGAWKIALAARQKRVARWVLEGQR